MVWYSWMGFLGLALGLALSGFAGHSWLRSALFGLGIGVAVLLLTGLPSAFQEASTAAAKANLGAVSTISGTLALLVAHVVKFAWALAFCLVVGVVVGFVGATPLRGAAAGLACGLVALFIANALVKDAAPCLQNAKGVIDILRAYTICR